MTELIHDDGDNPENRSARGAAYYHPGEYSKAVEDLETPGSDASQSICGIRCVAYAAVGEVEQALANLTKHEDECSSSLHRAYVSGLTFGLLQQWDQVQLQIDRFSEEEDQGEAQFYVATMLNRLNDALPSEANQPAAYTRNAAISALRRAMQSG